MYVVEGSESVYTSITQSIYWAIVTDTTVGYGDVVPVTVVGKLLSSIFMIIGYAIIVVPTGTITVELSESSKEQIPCSLCGFQNSKSHNIAAIAEAKWRPKLLQSSQEPISENEFMFRNVHNSHFQAKKEAKKLNQSIFFIISTH